MNNCEYSEASGWEWDVLDGYRAVGGHYQPNIVSYCGDKALNSHLDGEWYSGGLTERQDKSTARIAPSMIIARTNKEQLVEFLIHLVKNTETMAAA